MQKMSLIMGITIAVTMYRPPSGGYDLQRIDIAATAGIVITLLNVKYGVISTIAKLILHFLLLITTL